MRKRVSPRSAQSSIVLEINLGLLRYRTDDKAHAASLVFAAILLLALAVLSVVQAVFSRTGDGGELTQWLCSTFLFVISVAIGRAGKT